MIFLMWVGSTKHMDVGRTIERKKKIMNEVIAGTLIDIDICTFYSFITISFHNPLYTKTDLQLTISTIYHRISAQNGITIILRGAFVGIKYIYNIVGISRVLQS